MALFSLSVKSKISGKAIPQLRGGVYRRERGGLSRENVTRHL
jgi:hypothetical protein